MMKRVLSVLAASLFMFALALPTLALDKTATAPSTKSIATAQLRSSARRRRRTTSTTVTPPTSPIIIGRTRNGRLSFAAFPMRLSTNEDQLGFWPESASLQTGRRC